ncbi:MAG: ExbD/TolR family protein [Formosimonas sp.]
MAFHLSNDDNDVMSEINMTPLVDVMLVLLIIFIVAMPIMQHAVKINLPQATAQPQQATPKDINVEINAQGAVTWNGRPVDVAHLPPADAQSVVHVRADQQTPYQSVAQVMAALQNAGLNKVGLITQPQ